MVAGERPGQVEAGDRRARQTSVPAAHVSCEARSSHKRNRIAGLPTFPVWGQMSNHHVVGLEATLRIFCGCLAQGKTHFD